MELKPKDIKGKVVFIKIRADHNQDDLDQALVVAENLKSMGAEFSVVHSADMDISAFDVENSGIEPKILTRILTRLLSGESQDEQEK